MLNINFHTKFGNCYIGYHLKNRSSVTGKLMGDTFGYTYTAASPAGKSTRIGLQ